MSTKCQYSPTISTGELYSVLKRPQRVGDQQPGQQSGADDHVHGVHSGHRKVQGEKDRYLAGIVVALVLEVKIRPGNLVVNPVFVVLHGLHAEEG